MARSPALDPWLPFRNWLDEPLSRFQPKADQPETASFSCSNELGLNFSGIKINSANNHIRVPSFILSGAPFHQKGFELVAIEPIKRRQIYSANEKLAAPLRHALSLYGRHHIRRHHRLGLPGDVIGSSGMNNGSIARRTRVNPNSIASPAGRSTIYAAMLRVLDHSQASRRKALPRYYR
jgi:hypothetical protein